MNEVHMNIKELKSLQLNKDHSVNIFNLVRYYKKRVSAVINNNSNYYE